MVYISGGNLLEERSIWRLSAIPELFWAIVNATTFFFQTMVVPDSTRNGHRPASFGQQQRPPPKPPGGRRFGTIGPPACGPTPPPMGGG